MNVRQLSERLRAATLAERIGLAAAAVRGRAVFTTSFGLEDQALVHAIATSAAPIAVATLDTGRLFPETYDLWAATEERYGLRIEAFAPRADSLESLVNAQGINGFRASIEARKSCCGVRKVEPLSRALAGAAIWITGLRAGQSQHRAATPFAEEDLLHGVLKINPLADFSRADVERYVADHRVPYNPLHDRGYPSIGCAPCTRAVRVGEPERAGRWWWEEEAKKECGLHLRPAAFERAEPVRVELPA
jgi:phosphoadenosine phosphosulfate reductase